MQPPTAREARLETLLSDREIQLSELHDEVTRLQKYIPLQPTTSTTTPQALTPAVSSILIAQLSASDTATASSSSSTVVAALTQRAQLLQEENDELYELLRYSETGKLKEEVRGLRRLVQRLQNALRQSHDTIDMLSRELDKSYEAYLSAAQPAPSPHPSPRTHSSSPRMGYTTSTSGSGSHGSKPPPTGPRAQKRPRLSEPNPSFNQPHSGKSHSVNSYNHYGHNPPKRGADGHPKRSDRDGRVTSDANKGNWPSKMDIDKERPTPLEQTRGRDKDTDREHDRNRDRDRERNRERDRDRGPKTQDHNRERDRVSNVGGISRRNGTASGRANGRRGDRAGGSASFHGANTATSNATYSVNGDRTLAERMGL